MATPTTNKAPEEKDNPGQSGYEDLIRRENHARNYHKRHHKAAGDSSDPRGGAADDDYYKRQATPAGDSSDPRGDLKEREESPSEVHPNTVGDGYKPHKPSRLRQRSWVYKQRKKLIGGGITGTIIAALSFFLFSGPFEFIHMAQLMEQFHFSNNQDIGDDRFVRLARYIKYQSSREVERTRLGILQNKYADRIETKMNKTGIKSSYTDVFGFRDGYIVDPDQLKNTQFEDLNGKSRAQVREYFEKNFPGIDISNAADGKLFINAENLGYYKNLKLTQVMMKSAKYSRIPSVVGARVMGKRAGISWHPMKKLDRKILTTAEARYKKWRQDRAKLITEGTSNSISARSDPTDEDSKNSADEAAKEAKGTVRDAGSAGDGVSNGDPDAMSNFQDRLGIKVAAGGAGAAGVLCLAQGLGKSANEIKYAQVVLPLIRMGMLVVTTGNQAMAGPDADLEQLGFFKKQFNGKDNTGKKSSWIQANSIQAELGHPNSGVDADNTLKTISNGSPFDFLAEGPQGAVLNPICTVINSPLGIAVNFLGGPVSGAINTVIGEVLSRTLVPEIARWLAGKQVDPFVVGADFGNYINYGSFLASNSQMVGSGGRALSDSETKQLAMYQAEKYQADFRSKSLVHQIFNPYDQRSMVSRLIDQRDPNLGRNVTKFASSFLDIGGKFASFTGLFTSKAHAAGGYYDYGVPKIGFSVSEVNSSTVKNPYKNAEDVVKDILPDHPGWVDRAEKCFGVEIDSESYDIKSYDADDPQYKALKSDDCTSTNRDWMKVRFYVLDTQTMDSAACYEGDEQSCADLGFGSEETSSDSEGDGGGVSGDAKDLARQILNNNNIDLSASNFCRYCVEDIRNTSQGRPAYSNVKLDVNLLKFLLDLGNKINVDVNSITGAGSGHTDGSNHYSGLAIDFGCSLDVAKADEIGEKYGIKRYTGESCPGDGHWHYSTTGN